MHKHMPLIVGTLLMVIPTLFFVVLVLSTPLSFGVFALLIAVCLLCLIVGANFALNDTIDVRMRRRNADRS